MTRDQLRRNLEVFERISGFGPADEICATIPDDALATLPDDAVLGLARDSIAERLGVVMETA